MLLHLCAAHRIYPDEVPKAGDDSHTGDKHFLTNQAMDDHLLQEKLAAMNAMNSRQRHTNFKNNQFEMAEDMDSDGDGDMDEPYGQLQDDRYMYDNSQGDESDVPYNQENDSRDDGGEESVEDSDSDMETVMGDVDKDQAQGI